VESINSTTYKSFVQDQKKKNLPQATTNSSTLRIQELARESRLIFGYGSFGEDMTVMASDKAVIKSILLEQTRKKEEEGVTEGVTEGVKESIKEEGVEKKEVSGKDIANTKEVVNTSKTDSKTDSDAKFTPPSPPSPPKFTPPPISILPRVLLGPPDYGLVSESNLSLLISNDTGFNLKCLWVGL
jgi:hypothetical protein